MNAHILMSEGTVIKVWGQPPNRHQLRFELHGHFNSITTPCNISHITHDLMNDDPSPYAQLITMPIAVYKHTLQEALDKHDDK